MSNEVYNPDCQYFIERNGRKKVWINEGLVKRLQDLAVHYETDIQTIAEYFVQVGVNTVEHNPSREFDLENL
jgi:hypothetical protein